MKSVLNSIVFFSACLSFGILLDSMVFADIDKDTAGIWLLDEGKGAAVKDLTDNHNDGETHGGAEWVTGKFGKALEFDGTGGVIVPHSDSFMITKQITVEAWVLFTDAGIGQDMVIARIEPGFSLQKFNNDVIEGWVNIGGWQGVRDIAGGVVMKPNEWYHVAYIYDGNVLRTYVNGEPDRENKISGEISVAQAPFTIGSYKGESYFWKGIIDEVRVSSVARSEKDIKAVMDGFEAYLGVEPSSKLAFVWGKIKSIKP